MSKLRISEIFYSLQGETNTVGIPTVFIRLTGCPLRCHYCDTAYAFKGGTMQSFEDIFQQLELHNTQYVTVTGGEPLAQQNCLPLLEKLCDANYQVSLETSGAIDISAVDSRVVKVVDIKTPASGEEPRNLLSNLNCLQPHDQIKFVICDRADYEWCLEFLQVHKSLNTQQILFSPSYQQLSATELADWILADQLPVRLQIQLHKILWGDKPGV